MDIKQDIGRLSDGGRCAAGLAAVIVFAVFMLGAVRCARIFLLADGDSVEASSAATNAPRTFCIHSASRQETILLKAALEYAYFTGQVDAFEGRGRVSKGRDGDWKWDSTCWQDGTPIERTNALIVAHFAGRENRTQKGDAK